MTKIWDVQGHLEMWVKYCCHSFVSESWDNMQNVRCTFPNGNVVRCPYCCVMPCLNNWCKEIGHVRFTNEFRKCLCLSRTVWRRNAFRRYFKTVCKKKVCEGVWYGIVFQNVVSPYQLHAWESVISWKHVSPDPNINIYIYIWRKKILILIFLSSF